MLFKDEIGLFDDKEAANAWLKAVGYKVLWRAPAENGKQATVELQCLETGLCIKRTHASTLAAVCSAILGQLGVLYSEPPPESTLWALRRSLNRQIEARDGLARALGADE